MDGAVEGTAAPLLLWCPDIHQPPVVLYQNPTTPKSDLQPVTLQVLSSETQWVAP
jgi:hypothetical protein